MKRHEIWIASGVLALLMSAGAAQARDVDGGPDCPRNIPEWGDAPEGILAYPGGVIGRFPTCSAATPAGTQELFCPPISTPPGPTGFMLHIHTPNDFWLGCYADALGPMGIDAESDGKVNTPAVGSSACASALATDCVEAAFGMTFDQDECYLDGSDAGVRTRPTFVTCTPSSITFTTYNCLQPRNVILNVLVDYNEDGDWNDNFRCGSQGACAYEWAVKNVPIVLPTGCATLTTPSFLVGPRPGRTWFRISLTNGFASDSYPWAGSSGLPPQNGYSGGETEDYPAVIDDVTPANEPSWGRLKTIYR